MALQTVTDWLNNPPGGKPEWSPNRIHDYYDGIALAELLRQQKDKPMIYDVLFTLKAKKQLPTGEFIDVERVLGRSEAVPAASANAAVAIAARQLPTTIGEEELGAAVATVKSLSA